MSKREKLIIFDTTLRDGEQSPGASMTKDEKVRIAKALERMRVDVIEAGFPIASPGDFEAVQAVARVVKDATVCGLARALEKDIDRAGEALKEAHSARIHTFIATSPIHMERKLRMTPDQVVEQAVWAVKRARRYTDNVEFSAEDAGRSEIDFLCRIFEAVIAAGAGTINVPDTVGYSLPQIFGETMRALIERIPNSDQAVFSVHCHNDLGLAVANSLAAIQAGARQIECTVNGIGERAGNCSLEEIVMVVKVRRDHLPYTTLIRTEKLFPASQMLSGFISFGPQPNKAIVGRNAFAHEAGIHQDGVLKERTTYEIIDPKEVGVPESRLVLGKHSGRHALGQRCDTLGFPLTREQLDAVYRRFTALADRKKGILDEEIVALVKEVVDGGAPPPAKARVEPATVRGSLGRGFAFPMRAARRLGSASR